MSRKLFLGLILFFFGFMIGSYLLTLRTDYLIQDIRQIHLTDICELWVFDKGLQYKKAIALACSGVDLIRLWPLPVVQPWDDSLWYEDGEPEDLHLPAIYFDT